MAMPFCQLSFFYNTYSQCTVCTEQNLIYFVLLPGFHNLFDFGSCKPFFLQHLSLMIFSRHSVRGGTFPIRGGHTRYNPASDNIMLIKILENIYYNPVYHYIFS